MAKDLVKLRNEAQQLALKGKLDKALKIYQEIVAADPKDIKTWVKIGDVYKKMNRGEQAIEIYQKAAQSFALSGFLMQAISVHKMILEIDPNHRGTQEALAQLYAQKEGAATELPSADGGVKPGPKGASSAVLSLLKKKKDGATAAPATKPQSAPAVAAPEPEAEAAATVEPAAAAAIDTPAPASRVPQFDALDLDLADELFDQIMNQDVVVLDTEDDADKILAQLPEILLFSSLTREEFMSIVDKIQLRRFDVADKIIKEGEPGEAFYIIARGRAKVHKKDPKGRDVELASIGEGEFFGEFAFFSESVRHASVTVTEEMEALEIDRSQLQQVIDQFPRVKEVLKQFYKRRLVGTMMAISPLFQGLGEEDRQAILEKFESVEAGLGTVLIKQGQEGEGLFVIASGEVAVTVKDAKGQPIEVARLREGDFFGEISLITDQPTTANCLAVKPSELYKLPRATFKQLIAQYPQILEVTANYADERVKQTKKMISGGEALQAAGMV